jgi:hypothetical protein
MKSLSRLLAGLMLWTTLVAAAVIFAGLVWYLAAHPGDTPGDRLFSGEPHYLRDPVEMVRHALDWKAQGERRSLIMVGVVLLLAGPVLRVALAGLGYALQRDRLYAGVSLFILLVLLLSFFW